jgi:hypothetical protein
MNTPINPGGNILYLLAIMGKNFEISLFEPLSTQ